MNSAVNFVDGIVPLVVPPDGKKRLNINEAQRLGQKQESEVSQIKETCHGHPDMTREDMKDRRKHKESWYVRQDDTLED